MSKEPAKPTTAVEDEKVIVEEDNIAAPASAEEVEQSQAAKLFSQAGGKKQLSMSVEVNSPFRSYYKGRAYSLSAENETGPFDILPHHPNFISLLLPCDLIIRSTNQGDLKIRISGGVIHVNADKIIVFLDV